MHSLQWEGWGLRIYQIVSFESSAQGACSPEKRFTQATRMKCLLMAYVERRLSYFSRFAK